MKREEKKARARPRKGLVASDFAKMPRDEHCTHEVEGECPETRRLCVLCKEIKSSGERI